MTPTAAGKPGTFGEIAAAQGWDIASQLTIVSDYIATRDDDGGYLLSEWIRGGVDGSDANESFDEIASDQGWDTDSLLSLSLAYVADTDSDDGELLAEYALGAADNENAHDDLDGE